MTYNRDNEEYSIETINLTKVFRKKKHRGIFGFLKKEKKNKSSNSKKDVTVP